MAKEITNEEILKHLISMKKDIGSMKESNVSLQDEMKLMNESIRLDMKTGFETVMGHIVDIKEDIVEIKQDIVEIKQDIVEIREDIVEIRGDIKQMDKRLTKMEENNDAVKLVIRDHEKRITKIEATVA